MKCKAEWIFLLVDLSFLIIKNRTLETLLRLSITYFFMYSLVTHYENRYGKGFSIYDEQS